MSSYEYEDQVLGWFNGTTIDDWGNADEGGVFTRTWVANWQYDTTAGNFSSITTAANGGLIGENGDGHHWVAGSMEYNFYASGDYWHQIDGGRVVGEINGSGDGQTNESRGRSYHLTTAPSDVQNYAYVDGNNWGHNGNLSHSNSGTAQYTFKGDGSFKRSNVEDGASWDLAGTLSETGSYSESSSLLDGSMRLAGGDTWTEVAARAKSSTGSSFETQSYGNGTYQRDIEGGVVAGSTSFEGTTQSSSYFQMAANLTNVVNWKTEAYGVSDESVTDKTEFKGAGGYSTSGKGWATSGSILEDGSSLEFSTFQTIYDFVDDEWAAIRGSGNSSNSSSTNQSYSGNGGYSVSKNDWSLAGTMQESGNTADTSSSSVRYDLNNDAWRVAEGHGGTSFTSKNERSSAGNGAYSRKLDGGSISGKLNANSAASRTSSFATASQFKEGKWIVSGTGTSFDSDSNDYLYSGTGSYTRTDLTPPGSKATSSLTATVAESGKDESKSGYQYAYTLVGEDWVLSTGLGESTSTGNTLFNASGTGTFSETFDTGSHSGITTIVDADATAYGFKTRSTYNLPHPSGNKEKCYEVNYFRSDPELCIKRILDSSADPNANANDNFWRITGNGTTTQNGGSTYTYESKGAFADSGEDGDVTWQNGTTTKANGTDVTSYGYLLNYSLEKFEGKDSRGDPPPDGSGGTEPPSSNNSNEDDWKVVDGLGNNSSTGSETITLDESGSFTQTLDDGSINGSTVGNSTDVSTYAFNSTATYDTTADKWDFTGTGFSHVLDVYKGSYTGAGSFQSSGLDGKMSWTSGGGMTVEGKDGTTFEVNQTFGMDAKDNWEATGGALLSSYSGSDKYDMIGGGTYTSNSLINGQTIAGTSKSEETRISEFDFKTAGNFVGSKWETTGKGSNSSTNSDKQTHVGSGTFSLAYPGTYHAGSVTQEGIQENTSTFEMQFAAGNDGDWKVSSGSGIILSTGKDRLTHEGKGAVSNLNRNLGRCDCRRKPHREFESRGTRVGVRLVVFPRGAPRNERCRESRSPWENTDV